MNSYDFHTNMFYKIYILDLVDQNMTGELKILVWMSLVFFFYKKRIQCEVPSSNAQNNHKQRLEFAISLFALIHSRFLYEKLCILH